jgi:hypothetical protein
MEDKLKKIREHHKDAWDKSIFRVEKMGQHEYGVPQVVERVKEKYADGKPLT